MLEGPLVFVDVDTQRDFLDPTGALYVPGSEAIVANLARLTGFARRHDIPVLATADAHTDDDVEEIARFGRHCTAGSRGQTRIDATAWPGGEVLSAEGRFADAALRLPAHLIVEKRALDVFTHPDADRIVARYNRDRPTFVVYGVATDYCVSAVVLGLRRYDCKVAVVADAVRTIDIDREPEILKRFIVAGAMLTVTEVVCRE